MSVSKRLRFEVLRRDNHTCRYCGRSAPEVKLEVDHVVPEALGGPTEASNLATACEECNSGKASTAPDSPVVEEVRQDALRWSRAMQEAARIRRAQRAQNLAIRDWFVDVAWDAWTYGGGQFESKHPLDVGWEASLDNFLAAGLDHEDILYAIRLAMSNPRVLVDDKFRYFCGVCWRIIGELQETAAQMVDAMPAAQPSPAPRRPAEPVQPAEVSRAAAREVATAALRRASAVAARARLHIPEGDA